VSLVTPAETGNSDGVADMFDNDFFTSSDSDSVDDSIVELECQSDIHGNQLIILPSLVSVLEESTACKACTVEVLDELFDHFIKHYEVEIMSLDCIT
jgi:hypothetical protein